MTGASRLIVAGIAVAIVGGIVCAWQAAARASARLDADFTEAYGWDAAPVSSAGVYVGVAVVIVGVVLVLGGVITAAARSDART